MTEEKKNAFLCGQGVIDFPDIAAFVFWINLQAILHFVIYKANMRKFKAHVSAITF